VANSIRLNETCRKHNKTFNAHQIEYEALLDTDHLPEEVIGYTLGRVIDIVRQLFETLIARATKNLEPQDIMRFIIMSPSLDRPISTCFTYFFLSVGQAILKNDPEVKTLQNKRNDVLTRKVLFLHSSTAIPVGTCGFSEIAIFERYLDVQVIVISNENMNQVVYKRAERSLKVYLWLHNNHYDLIKSPKGFYAANHYCEQCNKLFDHIAHHFCASLCPICRKVNCVDDGPLSCNECSRQCRSEMCYRSHKSNRIFDKLYQCRDCHKVIEIRKCLMDRHVCDTVQCKGCKPFVSPGHQCYLHRVPPKQPCDQFIFYDFETQQDTGEHLVNFDVAQYQDGREHMKKTLSFDMH
ncbi:hypothetical protein JTE90_024194, partial [Oedothorax gibbosus]